MSAPAWRNRIVSYDTKPASQFAPNPLNWRTHPSVQREALRGLLGDVGWVGAVLENKQTGNLIDGHARIEEALSEDSTQLVPYLLVDLSPEEEKLVLASFDPISALATADSKRLEELLKDVSSSSQAVDSMLAELAKEHGVFTSNEPKDAEPQIDKAAELQQKWGTETGQLWIIGNHRLLVGDATDKADVGRLCANVTPSLMVTDPPYGVDYDPEWRQEAAASGALAYAASRVGKVTNDARMDWSEAYDLFNGSVAYLWHDALSGGRVQSQIEASGFQLRNQIIWAKSNFPISRGNYHWRHEACWYAVRKGQKSGWVGDHTQTTLWEINLDKNTDGGHSTQKPLECMARPIRNHSGDVYDPFVGSGTTLVAAENLNRKCYAIEISPAYVAVCLERMTTAFPHLKIEKVDQARAA